MYPIFRFAFQSWRHRADPPLKLGETHRSRHICWPWDLDPWAELNNGRALTLFDLGRLPLARRMGFGKVLRTNGWGMAVAGASVRYRARLRAFDRIEMASRALGWDHRFFYLEQSMWRSDGSCANHALLRMAVTSRSGIVAPAKVAPLLGNPAGSPPLPPWVLRWSEAEAERPWPPMTDAFRTS